MLNLSIMPLDTDHIDEICDDIIAQQRDGVSTHAMFMMKFNPEGTPAINKAEIECKKYDLFREKLDKAGAKHGVLVQSTLGHIYKPYEPYPFQPSVSLVTGEERDVTCCPLDPNTREYMKEQMRYLAKHKPSIIMIDDDMGLLYKPTKGCACKYHMAEFNRRAGTNMSREELYAHTQGTSEEDKKYTDIYVDVQRDGLVGMAKAMRECIDEVDPTIQGAVFLDDFSTDGFSDEEIKKFLSGTLFLSVGAAKKLADRGFMDYIGVEVHPWECKTISAEIVNGIKLAEQYNQQELKIFRDGVKSLSDVCHNNIKEEKFEPLFPGVTYFENPLGGETIVFSGTPDMPFAYFTAFSLLNETRKKQFIELISKRNRFSVYYPGDIDMYVKAGTLSSGEIMVALFNLSHDELDEIPLVISDKFTKIEKLNCDGTRSECTFDAQGNDVVVHEVSKPLTPVVLFIS